MAERLLWAVDHCNPRGTTLFRENFRGSRPKLRRERVDFGIADESDVGVFGEAWAMVERTSG